jgi:threonine/homoserine/homoserine lactone efflux protein
MLTFLTAGSILGLSAGFAPGPLLALVVSETLQHDIKAGVKVALAPMLTDLPIILLTLFVLARLVRFHVVLGVVSVIGACFIFYLGMKNITTRGGDIAENRGSRRSLQKGILVNALSPHPYLFWFTVGGPTTIKAMELNMAAAASFVLSFYILLVGSKIVLAMLVGKSRSFLQGNTYINIMRLLGIILLILGGFLLVDGLHLLGLF